jgi:integrase
MFPSSTGRVLDYFNFAGRCFKRAQRRAGLRALPLHNCRHTAASLWIAAGVDIVRVSKLLGHKDPAITLKVYTHDVEKLSEATSAEKLEAFLTRENDCATTARGALKVVNAA